MRTEAASISTMIAPIRFWNGPPESLSISNNTVHLWCFSLEVATRFNAIFWDSLCAQERGRADAFYFTRNRENFIAAHGLLRSILAGYLEVQPCSIIFRIGSYGRPYLSDMYGKVALEFNLSHSSNTLLIAVSPNGSVGVDVEAVRDDVSLMTIAENYFHPDEYAFLKTSSSALRRDAFFRAWTYKEAVIKYSGKGLQQSLQSILVPDVVMKNENNCSTSTVSGWPGMVLNLLPADGYIGALAVAQASCVVEYWSWRGVGEFE